jgi:hypothetical protein
VAYKVIPAKCPICHQRFEAASYQVYRAKLKGREPCCSKQCDQERRHKESRDEKWRATQLKWMQEQIKKSGA